MSTDESSSSDAFEELIKNAAETNKRKLLCRDDYRDENELNLLIREHVFRKKIQSIGYSIIEGGSMETFDAILKERLKEFIKRAVVNSEQRNGENLTKQDALDVVRQTNYFDPNKMREIFFTKLK